MKRFDEMKEKIRNTVEENKTLSAIWKWVKANRLFLLYLLFALLMEMVAVWTVEGSPFMSRPFILFGILLFLGALVLFIPNNRVRLGVYAVLLVVQGVLDIIFAVIYDLTGQYFAYEMLNLKNDAFGTLENLPVNFVTFYAGFFFCALYIIFGMRTVGDDGRLKTSGRSLAFRICATVVGIATVGISFVSYYPLQAADKYDEMINGSAESSYSAYGVVGNLLGEFTSSLIKDTSTLTDEEIENFVYGGGAAPESKYFGVSEGNNVVMVLGETFEWYSFMRNQEKYPNALGFTEKEMEELFPTLARIYNEGIIATNFHAREKTDISETLSLLGCYPTGGYINYDYQYNTIPYTVPSILKHDGGEGIVVRSYHDNFKTFYNRHLEHIAFGFESITDMYDMEAKAKKQVENGETEEPKFVNYMLNGERNLDSEMMEICKDEMFPTDKRFYTYITTVTMHGVYYERNNLAVYREQLAEVLGEERMPNENDREANLLFHYMSTALDFEKAMKIMLEDLETKNLLDKTTIVLFGDHNAYYHRLSNYVKDIDDYDNVEGNFTDLYNVPLMIYDTKLSSKIAAEAPEDRIVEKFTCTADITTTVLDLLGIHYYENLYYGSSIFEETASVLYSRAYDNFISDGIVASSVNNILYRYEEVMDEEVTAYKNTAIELVSKIKHCDYIFKQDYFGSADKLALFQTKMAKINS